MENKIANQLALLEKEQITLHNAAKRNVGIASQGDEERSFLDVLQSETDSIMKKVSSARISADDLAERLIAGDPEVSLPQTMVALRKADLYEQLAVNIKNKLVDAYKTIMNQSV